MADDIELGVADYLGNPDEPILPRLRDSLHYGLQQKPDTQAQIKRYARAMNVPFGAAVADGDFIQAQGKVLDIDPNGMVLGAPKTANWLAQPDNAAVAHDDIDVLKTVEQTLKNIGGLAQASAYKAGVGITGAVGALNDIIDPMGLVVGTGSSSRAYADHQRRSMSGAADAAMPKTDNPWAAGVNSGIVSLFQNLPLMAAAIVTKNPSVALGGMGTVTGGEAYGEAKDKGKNTPQALMYGAAQGGVEVLTEKLPMGALLGDIEKGTGFLKTFGKQLALDMPGEQLATVMQDLNEQVTLHPEKSMGDYMRERPNAAISTAVGSVIGSLGGTTVGKIAEVGQRGEERQAKAQESQQAGQMIGELMTAAQGSALRTRDPQTFKEFVDAATEGTPAEKVYVHAQDLVDALAQGSPEKLAENAQVLQAMPSVMAQVEDAMAGNGLVEIPVSELLAFTPDTGLAQSLIENLKIDPNGMSMKEAEAFMQTQAADLQADVAKAVENGMAADEFTASADRVRAAITEQLNTVNRFTADVNETNAQFLTSFYTTQAARLGITPEEMAARHPVTFQASGVGGEVFASSAKVLPGADIQETAQGVLFPVLPVQLPTEADGSVRIEKAFAGYAPGALNYAELNRTQIRAMNDLRDAAKFTTEDVPLADLVVTQRTVNPDFKASAKRKKGDGFDLPAVYKVNGRHVLSDGHHRATAALAEGKTTVEARVYDVDAAVAPSEELNQSAAHWNYEPGLGFQSALFHVVMNKGQAKASADQWLAMLQNAPGVKKDELEWIGLPEALALMGADGAVTREQVLTYIAQNGVRLEEVVQGGEVDEGAIIARAEDLENEAIQNSDFEPPYYASEEQEELDDDGEVVRSYWTTNMGGEYDTEEEAQDAADEANREAEMEWLADQGFYDQAREELERDNSTSYSEYQAIKGGKNYREVLLVLPKKGHPMDPGGQTNPRLKRHFTAGMGHWDHDNVLAHTRLADFTSVDGKRVLGVLEVQSDWHQKGREKGYAQEASAGEKAKAQQRLASAESALEDRLNVLRDVFETLDPAVVAEARSRSGIIEGATFAEIRSDTALMNVAKNAGMLMAAAQDSGTRPTEEMLELRAAREAVVDEQLRLAEAQQAVEQTEGATGIPDAPFKSSWPALVMKRVLRMAVEGGYDAVAWATGEQQADLYDMRARIGEIHVQPERSETGDLLAEGDGIAVRLREEVVGLLSEHGRALDNYGGGYRSIVMTPDKVREVFGLDIGGKIVAAAEEMRAREAPYGELHTLSSEDMIGGEGHKAFYNRNLVNITNDIIKKLGGRVGKVAFNAEGSSTRSAAELREKITALEAVVADLPPQEELEATHPRADQLRAELRGMLDRRYDVQGAERDALSANIETASAELRPLIARLDARSELEDMKAELATYTLTQPGFEITDKMRESLDNSPASKLFQTDDTSTARGTFNPSNNTITLLRNADLSTTLHELGHFYLETLARLAAEPDAPAEVKADFEKAARFIGFGGADPAAWLAIPVDGRREGHETWARGFEAYLREGKAPSQELRGPFQRFKSWMVHIYQSVMQLNVELTDEVRGVFDRLLATQEEIAKAEAARSFAPLFDTKPEGMEDAEWAAYQSLGAEATATAQDELAARSIRDMRWLQGQRLRMIRDLTKDAREKRKAVQAEVAAETLGEPVYAAQQFLRRGTLPDGQAWEGSHKLKIEDVAAIYEGTPAELQDWRKLGFGRYGMLAEDGLNPDQAAELFGFTSGHEMVEALLNAAPAREVIEGRTDQRMLERYGDLKDPEAIARAADEAIHNDARLRFVATEANALAKAAGSKRILAEAARDFAADLIGRQRVRDLKPAKYAAAETRAAAASAKAAAKGDLVTAATEKRNQLINAYAAKAAMNAQADVEKALRYLARFDSVATRKGMDPDYRDQVDALLERFDLRKGQSLKAIDKRKSLKAWIEAQQARGLDPVIDEQLANEAYRKHFRDLTVEEMRGLVDAVKNIAHLGRLKHKLLVAARGRAFQAVVDEAEAVIRDNAYRALPDKIERNTAADRILSGFANFGAIHRKFASLFREMSGLKSDGGILWRAFVEPMNKANDKEAAMRERATIRLAEVFKKLPDKKGDLRRKLFIPEIGRSLTLEGRLAVALNWGNELNRARIMDGDKWTAGQVDAILRTLNAEQLGFVNAMWEYLDSYWPEIAAKERRVTGVEPAKVEAEPFELTAADGSVVQMRGGYYPIKYDTERSSRSEADEIAEGVRAALRGAYTRATTRRGHTKARVDKVERPVRKDLMVPFGHVNQVIHDLAFHEYLIDANRLIAAPQIDAAIREHYGVEILRTIKQTIDDMAEGDTAAENALERAMNHVRTGTTIVGLGWNLTTGLLQPLGLTQSIVRIGPKYVAKGIGRAFADAFTLQNTVKAIGEKSDFMRLRGKTLMREINEVQNTVKDGLKPEAWGPVEASYFFLIQKLQLVADVPTWLGAYAKAQDNGADEETAVALADQAVRDSQGSGQIGDLAQIQRGGVWFKLWTNFYSFFNIGYNQIAESVAETRRVGPARLPFLAADVLLVAVLPVVLGELMKNAVRGEDWDWGELGPQLAKAQASYLLGFMVGLRELGGMISSDGKAVSGPASLRLITQDAPRLYTQVQQAVVDGDLEGMRKPLFNVGGVLFHFPAGQINRTIDGIEALAKGETRNPMAVFAGPPRN